MTQRSLDHLLTKERGDTLLRQATLVRNWPEGPERAKAAQALIRETFVAWATGKIMQDTESAVYSILSFAMPENACSTSNAVEVAYLEQLARRDCPDCGDGGCQMQTGEAK